MGLDLIQQLLIQNILLYKKCPTRAQKVKNNPNIKSKSNARVEGNIENESCSTTKVDPKTVVKPYSNPQTSPLGPHKTKTTPKLSQNQISEFKNLITQKSYNPKIL